MAARGFTRGTFVCQTCGHTSRGTTEDATRKDMCGKCQELSGLQNSLWDDGIEHFVPWGPRERDRLTKGFDATRLARVKRQWPELFAAEVAK